ncbi:MAG: hypothetical protein ACQGVK_05870 [Myxococcota bacterium]
MQFEQTTRVSHPADAVLETLIERMEELVEFFPNLDAVEFRSREETADGRTRIVRVCRGRVDGVPAPLRPFVSPDLLSWTDTAVWSRKAYEVEWSHESCSRTVAGLYRCSGVNSFKPHPENPERETEIRISGELQVDPHVLPGVPRFLGRTLAPQIERFVVELIKPNLDDVAKGVQGYLDARGGV